MLLESYFLHKIIQYLSNKVVTVNTKYKGFRTCHMQESLDKVGVYDFPLCTSHFPRGSDLTGIGRKA